MCGFLNGTVGVTKSMLGEMTDSTNRGLAFAIWESSFGIGQIGKFNLIISICSWACSWWTLG